MNELKIKLSFLYGQLLAILEKKEKEIHKCIFDNDQEFPMILNTQIYLEEYKENPGKTYLLIISKSQECLLELERRFPEKYKKLETEEKNVLQLLNTIYLDIKNIDQLLDYPFMMGYLTHVD